MLPTLLISQSSQTSLRINSSITDSILNPSISYSSYTRIRSHSSGSLNVYRNSFATLHLIFFVLCFYFSSKKCQRYQQRGPQPTIRGKSTERRYADSTLWRTNH